MADHKDCIAVLDDTTRVREFHENNPADGKLKRQLERTPQRLVQLGLVDNDFDLLYRRLIMNGHVRLGDVVRVRVDVKCGPQHGMLHAHVLDCCVVCQYN